MGIVLFICATEWEEVGSYWSYHLIVGLSHAQLWAGCWHQHFYSRLKQNQPNWVSHATGWLMTQPVKKRWLKSIISNNPCLRAEHHNSHQLPSPRSWDSFPVNSISSVPPNNSLQLVCRKNLPSLRADRKHQDSSNARYQVYTPESGTLKATCKEQVFVSSFASLKCIVGAAVSLFCKVHFFFLFSSGSNTAFPHHMFFFFIDKLQKELKNIGGTPSHTTQTRTVQSWRQYKSMKQNMPFNQYLHSSGKKNPGVVLFFTKKRSCL